METINLDSGQSKNRPKMSIEDDFMYGSNVATAHVYIRLGFLRKVYGILTAQLLVTTLIGGAIVAVDSVREFTQQSPALLMISMIATFLLIFPLHLKSRETPTNYLLLGAFTFFESILVGTAASLYEVHSVVLAFALTFAVTAALTVYTLQSKMDFSHWGAGLFSALWILIVAGFLQIFFQSEMMDLLIGVGGAFIFSFFIVFDTYMITHRVSPEDYIHATISLYLDILNLFLHLLRIFGEARRN